MPSILTTDRKKHNELFEAVKDLKMVKRRQEIKGSYKGSVVIDDFAHHPRAIKVTIETVKQKYPEKKIVVVFEPISATARSNIFQNDFVSALSSADDIIITPSNIKSTAIGKNDLDIDLLCQEISQVNRTCCAIYKLDDLLLLLDQKSNNDTIFLILSNRTCLGLWESSFVESISH